VVVTPPVQSVLVTVTKQPTSSVVVDGEKVMVVGDGRVSGGRM
jgi:hypothetical protein